MADLRTFTIDALPNDQFREAACSPVDILALSMQVDFDQFAKTKEVLTFALEHCEVLVGDKWYPVKTAGREVYNPIGLEKNYKALNQICAWFINTVLAEVFQESAE